MTGFVSGTSHWPSHVVPFLCIAKALGQGVALSLVTSPLLIADMANKHSSNPGLTPKCMNGKNECRSAPGGVFPLILLARWLLS